ncbi:hypothetical protein M2337_000521 [Sphingobium sp. B2D3A]|uniref:hypothetical protein n=1 Tax=unclassified Sphingobium TaxID=2611147 RepID=UPI002225B518|nr:MULTISPECIES: hypothetical protein [unclassified Sphingobium]MCW2336288.1 hypothetical protein [Sphingobium sp. B2D3A]MCW2386043.1 hypothetical protein [Sphingobium sp. B2D3D]
MSNVISIVNGSYPGGYNMKISKTFIALAALALTVAPAHSKKRYLDLNPVGETQRSRMDAGVETVESALAYSSVRVFESEEPVGKRGSFSLLIFNAAGAPINFGSENVAITMSDGETVAVVPYERLLKEEKSRQMWAAIATGLSAASNSFAASQAGTSYGSTSYSATSFSRAGTINSFGSGTYTAYNPGVAYAAQATANVQNQQLFDRLAATNAANLEGLRAFVRTTTVDPESSFGGLVTFELPKKARKIKGTAKATMVISVGDEQHVFDVAIVER